jgi:hypothetical protein
VFAITLRRHPIATTLGGAVLFAVLRLVLWLALPLSGNNLVGRDSAFEEVRQLPHVLQFHEGE